MEEWMLKITNVNISYLYQFFVVLQSVEHLFDKQLIIRVFDLKVDKWMQSNTYRMQIKEVTDVKINTEFRFLESLLYIYALLQKTGVVIHNSGISNTIYQ